MCVHTWIMIECSCFFVCFFDTVPLKFLKELLQKCRRFFFGIIFFLVSFFSCSCFFCSSNWPRNGHVGLRKRDVASASRSLTAPACATPWWRVAWCWACRSPPWIWISGEWAYPAKKKMWYMYMWMRTCLCARNYTEWTSDEPYFHQNQKKKIW